MANTRSRPQNRGDVVINGKKYPLFDDPKRGLAWWREGGQDIQEGSAAKEVTAIWDRGWRGGMGETKRMSPDSMGYAFSLNMDCTPDGYARISGRRITVTPTNAPPDAKTYFAIDGRTGNAVYNVGTFAKSTTVGTTSQTVAHGLGVVPKAIIFWTSGKTVSGTVAAAYRASFGFTDGTTERGIGGLSADGVTPSAVSMSMQASALVTNLTSSTAITGSCPVANWDATNFQINWTANDATADIWHFMAIGGSDAQASVDAWTMPVASGTSVNVTGVGFSPDVVITLGQSALTALGHSAHFHLDIGAMDSSGNQWATSVYAQNGEATSNTKRKQVTTAFIDQAAASVGSTHTLSFGAMTSDGFTSQPIPSPQGSAFQGGSLCLRGLRAKVGSFTKATGAAPVDQAAQTIGFTTTAFFLASVLNTTSTSVADHAALALGAASGTTAVEASAWYDEDNVNPTDSYGLDDTALAFEKIDATGAENATATCANIDMEQTGWINWATNDAVATQICYVAFAALAGGEEFIYSFSGQRSWKMSVNSSTNAITVEEEKDWGNNAVLGKPDQFEGLLYLPAGGSVLFQELTTIAASGGTDTWSAAAAGLFATAFCGSHDGPTAELLRAYPTNLVKLAATAPGTAASWGSQFEIGDSSSAVVEAVDTGPSQFVSKTDGVYKFITPGIATKVPISTTIDADGGVGLIGVQGTETAFVSYPSGFWCIDGDYVRAIGPDTIRSNEAIPNVTLEPFRGRHYENAIFGRWIYSLYRVTESSTTRTYILAGYIHRLGAQPVIEWHTPFAESGAARGLGIFEINDKVTLWTQVGGQFVYRVLGRDGSPNAGRDAIGYGAASTQHQLFLPLTDSGLPHTTKQARVLEVKTRNLNANCPVQLQISRDGAALANVGATVTSDGVSKRYWTLGSSDTARDAMVVIDITTGASYAPATDDPQIWGVVLRSVPIPDHAGVYTVIINTGARYKNGAKPPESVKKMRDDMISLTTSSAVACADPDTNAIDMKVLEVKDTAVMQDATGAVWYVLELTLEEFVNA